MAKTGSKINGSLPRDNNNQVIQTTSVFVTQDATGTPNQSPFTFTTSVTTLVVPDRAISIVVRPSVDMNISVTGDNTSPLTATKPYYIVLAGNTMTIPCTTGNNIYIAGNAAGGTLNFYFCLV